MRCLGVRGAEKAPTMHMLGLELMGKAFRLCNVESCLHGFYLSRDLEDTPISRTLLSRFSFAACF